MTSSTRQAVTELVSARPAQPRGADGSCLVVIDGPRLGHCVRLDEVPVVIGRSSRADFQAADPSVSRLHCTAWLEGSAAFVRDLESKNGTRVNGVAVEHAELAEGDQLALGEVVLKYVLGGTPEARYHEALYELATLDSLTQLHNRREFRHCLEAAIHQGGGTLGVSIAIFDLDHFKQINDVLGHDVGDWVLRDLSEEIRALLRPGDIAGRLGGDEFAVLLFGAGLATALQWSERLRLSVEDMDVHARALPHPLSVSIGVATWVPEMQSTGEMMRLADMALLAAKADDRNCVRQAKQPL